MLYPDNSEGIVITSELTPTSLTLLATNFTDVIIVAIYFCDVNTNKNSDDTITLAVIYIPFP